MELLVLSTLKWRMQACTPCCFIDYFLRKINSDMLPSRSLINRSILFILNTIKGIDFLEFRPSEIAAAVAMCVSGEVQAIDIDQAMSCFIHAGKISASMKDLCHDNFGISKEKKDPKNIIENRGDEVVEQVVAQMKMEVLLIGKTLGLLYLMF